ncbi:unnamed protein product [Vitrella brassicaformis CCMP3155]|uniref:Uncharacterized protein n=1 Tax=Vitrella brassicaformis (strain CCMP3155) TaxID=1169540 RepID=A0A0G4ETU1_VITBC|nr:unnamed protein product [Vitrella brassicaformis CCMP3155]|eukprot:CEM01742.1 unnamed protein product [Vitrella brassicaformis CCMP3155]
MIAEGRIREGRIREERKPHRPQKAQICSHGGRDGHRQPTAAQQQEEEEEEEEVTHSIDLEAFAQRFSQIPVVVAYVFSFVSLHLVAALPQRLWRHVGCQITQLVTDTHDTAERRFWCGLSFSDAFEWGRRLTRLKSIVVKYPPSLVVRHHHGFSCDYHSLSLLISNKIVTALVEGHSEGRRAAAATATGRQAPTTLESIDISEGGSDIIVEEAEGRDIRAATEPSVALPPPLDPPPTLTSLRSIIIPGHELSMTGIIPEDELSCPGRGRHWQLPSLETVQVRESAYDGEVLGELVATSRRLKELHVECHPDVMAGSLRRIPVAAAAGQPGLLSRLEDIGTLSVRTGAADLEGLQEILVDRGCRSIKKLSIRLEDYDIDSSIFAPLSAIETFASAVCVSPDIVDTSVFGTSDNEDPVDCFDLGLLCEVPTNPAPSFFVQRHIQQLAAASERALFTILPDHLTTPLDTPSPAAIALAECLTFPKATAVTVRGHGGFAANAEEVDPLVFDSMPDSAFPAASSLYVHSGKGLAIGRRLVSKMPVVKRIDLRVPTEEDAVGVLQAVGAGKSLECFNPGWVDVSEGGLTWVDMADHLPTIKRLDVRVEVPHDLGVGDAAGEFGIACVKSLLKIRGIKELKFALWPHHGGQSFKRLVDERTNGDTVEGLEGRFDIEWGWPYSRQQLILKPLDT